MTSTHFVTMIQSAEHGTSLVAPVHDRRFSPGHEHTRALGARWLRAHAAMSLRWAQRIDPHASKQHLAAA